jgi:hypothetical protein
MGGLPLQVPRTLPGREKIRLNLAKPMSIGPRGIPQQLRELARPAPGSALFRGMLDPIYTSTRPRLLKPNRIHVVHVP